MTADKTTTKQKISAAAKNLFSIHGYSETTIDDIITAAGVTKGAFYHYFKSKETVCSEIIDSIQGEYQNLFETPAKEANPLERLKTVIKQLLELNNSGQWVNCKLMLRLGCQMQTLRSPLRQKIDGFWKWCFSSYLSLITQCRESNLISDRLSAEQQTEFVVSILAANIWAKMVFDKNADWQTIDYIIEKL